MQLYFIRHGQSANNLLFEQTGSNSGRSYDPEITASGRRQSELLADFLSYRDPPLPVSDYNPQNLAGFDMTHLYTSLMIRAVATGTILAERLGLPLIAWEDWHEGGGIYLDNGSEGEKRGLPGPNRAYFEQHYPKLVLPDSLGQEGWWNRSFEEHEQRITRAQRVLDELIQRHGGTDHHVAVISHGGFYKYFLTRLLGLSNPQNIWFNLNNAALARIDFLPEVISVVYLNRVDFLPKELIT